VAENAAAAKVATMIDKWMCRWWRYVRKVRTRINTCTHTTMHIHSQMQNTYARKSTREQTHACSWKWLCAYTSIFLSTHTKAKKNK
jgi:hypothetical protein